MLKQNRTHGSSGSSQKTSSAEVEIAAVAARAGISAAAVRKLVAAATVQQLQHEIIS